VAHASLRLGCKLAFLGSPDMRKTRQDSCEWPRTAGRGTVIQAALLLLYDLLREYCEQCVSLTISIRGMDQEISPSKARSLGASGNGSLIEFDGLNSAQRQEMYDLFDQIDNLYGRPEIANYKDLIANWFKNE
jgi:hypothetical protein